MLGEGKGSAEVFHGRCLANAQTLERAARAWAQGGESVRALFAAWGADLSVIEALAWERIVASSTIPTREFFDTAGRLIAQAAGPESPSSRSADTVEGLLLQSRATALAGFNPELAHAMKAQLPDTAYLAGLAAPSLAEVAAHARAWLEGMTPEGYVQARHSALSECMSAIHLERVRANVPGAIAAAYDAAFLALDAYLVESSIAADDRALGTTVIRYAIATAAMGDLPALPDDYARAVATIHDTLCMALGDADGDRLRATFVS